MSECAWYENKIAEKRTDVYEREVYKKIWVQVFPRRIATRQASWDGCWCWQFCWVLYSVPRGEGINVLQCSPSLWNIPTKRLTIFRVLRLRCRMPLQCSLTHPTTAESFDSTEWASKQALKIPSSISCCRKIVSEFK